MHLQTYPYWRRPLKPCTLSECGPMVWPCWSPSEAQMPELWIHSWRRSWQSSLSLPCLAMIWNICTQLLGPQHLSWMSASASHLACMYVYWTCLSSRRNSTLEGEHVKPVNEMAALKCSQGKWCVAHVSRGGTKSSEVPALLISTSKPLPPTIFSTWAAASCKYKPYAHQAFISTPNMHSTSDIVLTKNLNCKIQT